MDDLLMSPAFRTYAVCSAILGIKMLLTGNYTTLMRLRHRAFVNPEDAAAFGGTQSEQENPAVAHALRIQRNDLENIPVFWAVGLVFVLSGASASAAWWYCWTFTIARLVHWAAYLSHVQPWRALTYFVGYLAILGMAIQILL